MRHLYSQWNGGNGDFELTGRIGIGVAIIAEIVRRTGRCTAACISIQSIFVSSINFQLENSPHLLLKYFEKRVHRTAASQTGDPLQRHGNRKGHDGAKHAGADERRNESRGSSEIPDHLEKRTGEVSESCPMS
jgi:hypothetical protein